MTVTYVVYEKGWPICTGPLDYVCHKTGRSKEGMLYSRSKKYANGGFERAELDESELERKWER